ncbi:hypothetical protein ACFLZ6_01320 [Nanoarchaeota archaeon]
MKKLAPYLRLFSDAVNAVLLLAVILKGEYTIPLLCIVAIAWITRIIADVVD